ncbi:hypothetical protein ACJX0J_006329, partial [Zea mays]
MVVFQQDFNFYLFHRYFHRYGIIKSTLPAASIRASLFVAHIYSFCSLNSLISDRMIALKRNFKILRTQNNAFTEIICIVLYRLSKTLLLVMLSLISVVLLKVVSLIQEQELAKGHCMQTLGDQSLLSA